MKRLAVRAWGTHIALGALLAYYVALSTRHLTVVPRVFEDEPWFASTGLKWATDGVFGSDMFAGFYGMERRYYAFMPVAPMLLAATFRLFGFGLLQLRLESVSLGAITLFLTYALGQRLFSRAVGVVAVAFLLIVRMDGVDAIASTGILFLDAPRIGRYDMPTPVFGLAALLVYLAARDRDRHGTDARVGPLYAVAGALAGLSGLTHLYGLFWPVALGVLAMLDRVRRSAIVWLGVGFLLPWLPYALYVLTDLHNWAGQTRGWAPRFGLRDPAWYLRNVLREPFRYAPGLGEVSPAWLLRPGLWAGLILIPASLVALIQRARGDSDARALAVTATLIPLLFALLITFKFRNYKVAFFPLLALSAAWGLCALWAAADSGPGRRWWRAAILLVATLATAEGLSRAAVIERLAGTVSPYAPYVTRIRAHIPPGTRVLGLHTYWIGFEDTHYRSWWVPVAQMDAWYHTPQLTLDEAMQRINPEVVLLDERMRAYLVKPMDPKDPRPAQIKVWLQGWVVVATVDDSTYGRMDIHRPRERARGGLLERPLGLAVP
jgi:4-amino-4-deoxy-L-arabinose transferase-like glycosyltransferase